MKLLKATTEEVCEFNEVELLQMENDFLRDELELQDTLHSLELMETVLKCIEQEGEVSRSIEVMFGEGQDMSTFKDDLKKAYDEAMEGFIRHTDNRNSDKFSMAEQSADKNLELLNKISKLDMKRVEYPVKISVPAIDSIRGRIMKAVELAKSASSKLKRPSYSVEDKNKTIVRNALKKIAFEFTREIGFRESMSTNHKTFTSASELSRYIETLKSTLRDGVHDWDLAYRTLNDLYDDEEVRFVIKRMAQAFQRMNLYTVGRITRNIFNACKPYMNVRGDVDVSKIKF